MVPTEGATTVKLIEINWNPTSRQLRQFGLISLVAIPLIGWIWGATTEVMGWCAVAGASLALVGGLYPVALKPIFLGLTLLALPIGLVMGELAMLTIYLTVFLPIGTIFRILGRDRLRIRVSPSGSTYWQLKKQPAGPASYFRQS